MMELFKKVLWPLYENFDLAALIEYSMLYIPVSRDYGLHPTNDQIITSHLKPSNVKRKQYETTD